MRLLGECPDFAPGLSMLVLGAGFRAPLRFQRLQRYLQATGLESLCVEELTDEGRLRLTTTLQDAGQPCPQVSGGELIAVVLNLCPRKPRRRGQTLGGSRDDRLPHQLRKRILASDPRCSELWVSENSPLAWQCIAAALPETLDDLTTRVADLRRRFETPLPVIAPLGGYSANAKVELVQFRGQRAVCKTFKPGRDRFFQRELLATTRLAPLIEEIPPLLEAGDNWLVYPYYADARQYSPDGLRLLPLDRARRVGKLIEKLHSAGYAHLDLGFGNLLFGPAGEVILIDFEYLHQYPGAPLPLQASYDVVGPPADFRGDRPLERTDGPPTYATRLMPGIGLSFESLLDDPPWRQHRARASYFVRIKLRRYALAALRARKRSIRFALQASCRALHTNLSRTAAA